jgi:hypothetical protein
VLVKGMRVAGFDDPLEYSSSRPDNSNRVFSFAHFPDETASVAFAEWRLDRWFASLSPRPDVVLIHQNRLAQYLARKLWAQGYSSPLTI